MDIAMKEEVTCVICNSNKYLKNLPEAELRMVKCTKCKIAFRVPKISSEELKKIYENEYPSVIDEKSLEKYRLKLFENILNEANKKVSKKGCLLDVGCGYGKFIELAANSGWEVLGTELFKKACEFINRKKSIKAYYGELENLNFKENSFHVVTLWHVLHHMYNPKEQLSEIYRILKPKGEIFLRSPNFTFNYLSYKIVWKLENVIKKILRKNIHLCDKFAVFHNTNYSKACLEGLLKQSGFFEVEIRNGKPTWGDPYKAFPILGNYITNFIKKGAFLTFDAIYRITNRKIILGPSIEVWAKKNETNKMIE